MKTKKEELQAELTRLNALRKQVKEKLKSLPVLEIGKWYKHIYGGVSFFENESDGYGYDSCCNWYYGKHTSNIDSGLWREATPQEVEKALIEEAKRRYKVVEKVKCLAHGNEIGNLDFIRVFYYQTTNDLWISVSSKGRNIKVFDNGKWAEVIKDDDKFEELKEAHSNGAVIEFRSKYTNFEWEVTLDPAWGEFSEYRIKPEEKPKVGDVVKAWDNESSAYTVGKVIEINSMGYFLQDDLWWDNAKTLTQQETIDLLFNKGAN